MGNGWCARADPAGKVRIGTDRKQWVVVRTGASVRWVRVAGTAARSRRPARVSVSGGDGDGDGVAPAAAGPATASIMPTFAVVRCGYTERLLTPDGSPNSELQQVMESSDEVDLLFVAGDGATADYVAPTMPKRLERRSPGEIVVRVRDPSYKPLAAIFSFVENLMGVYHCGFFRLGTLSEMAWNSTGKVLSVEFETEAV